MTRYIIVIFTLCMVFSSCGQGINGLTIDPGVKKEAEKHIEDADEFVPFRQKMDVYANSVFIESFKDDSLNYRTTNAPKKMFKSFYYWVHDTLTIDGGVGLLGCDGFSIVIHDKKATLYHLVSADDNAEYAYGADDSLQFRLQVPCTDTKIILSEIPDKTKQQVIFGYVEFKSASYFAIGGVRNGLEDLPRQKLRENMKIYFRSRYLRL